MPPACDRSSARSTRSTRRSPTSSPGRGPGAQGRDPLQHSGVSLVTAAAVLAEIPELTLEAATAASLTGLAPFTRESGTWKGRAKIGGGRRDLRRALYLPAHSAARCNPDLKVVYDRLRAKGKPAKLALVAVMRQLVILANVLVRNDRTWQPRA